MVLLGLLLSLLVAQQQADSGTVRGQIRNRDGTPAAAIRVALIDALTDTGGGIRPDAPLSNISQTDSQGRYRLEGVEPGRYLIIAGPLNAASYYPGVTTPEEGTRVLVAAGREVTGVDFVVGAQLARIPQRPTVRGLVVVNNGGPSSPSAGLPANHARLVTMQVLMPLGRRQVVIDGQFGSFSIDVATPGDYFLSLSQMPFGYHLKSMTFGNVDLTQDPIRTPVAPNTEVQIVLTTTPPPGTPPGVRVSGRTLGEGTGVRLWLKPPSLALRSPPPVGLVVLGFADVTPEGTFEFNSVPPGGWILSSTGAGSQTLTLDVARSDITNLVMDSRPNLPTSMSLTTLQGTVALDGASPNFEIRFTATRGGAVRSVPVSGKEFSVQLPEGEYRAEISGLPEGLAVESVTAGPLDLSAPFQVTRTGIADRFGAIIRGAGIAVRLKAVPAGQK